MSVRPCLAVSRWLVAAVSFHVLVSSTTTHAVTPVIPQLTEEQKVCLSAYVVLLRGLRIVYRDIRAPDNSPDAKELFAEESAFRAPILEAKILRSFFGDSSLVKGQSVYLTDLERSYLFRPLEYEMIFFLYLDEPATRRWGRPVLRVPS